MKKRFLFIALLISLLCLSVNSIYATDIDTQNNLTDVSIESANLNIDTQDSDCVSLNSNVYSNNNIYIEDSADIEEISINDQSKIDLESSEGEKQLTTIDASNFEIYFKNGTAFEATLLDSDGNPISGQILNLKISGVSYERVSDENGKITFSINLSPGTYELTVSFAGNDIYQSSQTTVNVKVLSSISGDNIIKYYKNDTQYYALFLDGNGNPLANTNVTFNINGVFYTRTTNNQGIAKLTINLNPNEYILTAIHPNGLMYSNNITVLPTVSGNNLVKIYQDGYQYYATFLDSNGNPLANTNVTFNIHGVFYTRTTNGSGVARLNINLLPGDYILTAIHPTTSLMHSNTIKVLSYSDTHFDVEDISMIVGENKTLTTILYDELGHGIPNQKVIITIADKVYTLTTDAMGKVSLLLDTLQSGEYTVMYKFDKTSSYGASTATSNLLIRDYINVIYEVNNTVFIYDHGEYFYLLVKDEFGSVLANSDIIFTINGKEYTKTTDEFGIAKLQINLIPGTFTISYRISKEGYNPYGVSSQITIVSTNQTILSGSDVVINYNNGEKYSVKLTVGGVPLANQVVVFTIKGIKYNRTTDENGVASIAINLIPGNYDISYEYEGSSRFEGNSGNSTITVVQPISTTLTYTGKIDYVDGSHSAFTVVLKDVNGNVLPNQKVTISINGKDYVVTTDGDGVASLTINLNIGTYNVNYRFDGAPGYSQSSGSVSINVIPTSSNGNGYWVQGKDMNNVNLANLAKQGVGNIFLNFYAFTLYGEPTVLQWISQANSYNIKVHVWMQSFYDGGWVSPVLSDGTPNYDLLNKKIDEAAYYASLPGVAGVHLDYLRFPGTAYKYNGGTEAINTFVKSVSEAVRAINPNILLSAAVMPEKSSNPRYYGQDVTVLGKYLDIIVPMIYKGNYNAGTSWITSTTKWFVENSQGAQIWAGLQTYRSDSDVTLLSASELAGDAQAAINGGASGVVMFRFGVSNLIDFNNLNYPTETKESTGVSVSMSEIYSGSSDLKKYIEDNGILPSTVSVSGNSFSTSQFLYLMSQYIVNFGGSHSFESISVAKASNPTGDTIHGSILKSEYTAIAKDVIDFIKSYGKAPENMATSLGKIKYDNLIYTFSKVVNYMGSKGAASSFVYVGDFLNNPSLTVTMLPSSSTKYDYIYYTTTWLNFCPHCGYYGSLLINPKGTVEGELTCDYCDADYCGVSGNEKISSPTYVLTRLTESQPGQGGEAKTNLTLDSILNAANNLKTYIEANGDIPDSILIDNSYYSLPQFLYLMSAAIENIYNSNFVNINVIDVAGPSNPSGSFVSAQLVKDDYYDVASRVAAFILKYGEAPNYASSSIGNIVYDELIDAFSRILAFYKNNNNVLPSYVQINSDSSSESVSSLAEYLTKGLTTEYSKAQALFNWVRDEITYQFYYNTQKGADLTLSTRAGNCCDQAQLLVAMARSVGLTVRFATGTCTFSSGSVYGHVWVQFYLDGKWVVADPTSSRNSLGIVNNWNTKNYVDKGTYNTLPY